MNGRVAREVRKLALTGGTAIHRSGKSVIFGPRPGPRKPKPGASRAVRRGGRWAARRVMKHLAGMTRRRAVATLKPNDFEVWSWLHRNRVEVATTEIDEPVEAVG